MGRDRLAPGSAGRIVSKKNPTTGKWQARVRYRDALGGYSTASATALTRTKAEEGLQEKLAKLTSTSVTHGVATVGDLCEQWLSSVVTESDAFWALPDAATRQGKKPPRPQSLVHLKRSVRYICADGKDSIGELGLREVTTLILQNWLDGHALIARGRAAEIRIALRAAFKYALRLGIIAVDPMAGVAPVRRNDPAPIALTAEELRTIRRVLRTSRDLHVTRETTARLDALLVVLLGTAMRVGEATALRWDDLILTGPDPTVSITGTQVELSGRGTVRQNVPKTAAGNRTILLPPAVVDAFMGLRPQSWRPDGYVFVTKRGTQWNSGNADKVLDMVIGAAEGQLDPHRVTFHKLRSTAATAIQRQHGTEAAGQVLGHKGIGVTRLFYVAKPEVVPDVRDVLQRLVESSERPAEPGVRAPARRRHLRAI